MLRSRCQGCYVKTKKSRSEGQDQSVKAEMFNTEMLRLRGRELNKVLLHQNQQSFFFTNQTSTPQWAPKFWDVVVNGHFVPVVVINNV